MFFFLPWGHDHPVYERPWLTYGLIAACVAIFGATAVLERQAMAEVNDAAYRVAILVEAFPDARVGFTVHGLPRELEALIAPLVDVRPDRVSVAGDADLEAAMLDLVAGLNHLPMFRFGFRPGAPSALGLALHAFVHADVFHLMGNMLLLFVAGGVLECFWRRWAYVALYLLAGAAGLAAQVAAAPASLTPMIGASGCIAGLLGAFLVGYPRTRVRIAYFVMVTLRPRLGSADVPAWVVLPLWAGLELVSALLAPPEGGGVAYWAHVGGFVCGAVVALVARRSGLVATDAGYEVVRGTGEAAPAAPAPLGSPLALPHLAPGERGALRPGPAAARTPVGGGRPAPRDIEASELPPAEDGDTDLIER